MLQKDRKFCYNLMVMGKTHQNKSIEDFVFFSPAPCYTAANLSALYRDSALKEKDRGEFVVYIFSSLFTIFSIHMFHHVAADLLLIGEVCEELNKDLLAIGK